MTSFGCLACRYQVQRFLYAKISGMAQPHKGQREQIKVRAATPVYARLREMAAERGTSVSQLSADLLAIAVGHPEAVRELDKEVLPLAM
jgi:predicted HicB family RNase H-like nuclease